MTNGLKDRVAAKNAPGTTVETTKPKTLEQQVEMWQKDFELAMPRGAEARQLVRDIHNLLRTTKNLALCTPASVLGGAMTFAQLGLRPGVLGHGWLIPFKRGVKQPDGSWVDVWEATIVIGYKGYVELVHRAGQMKITGRCVHVNDYFEVEYGTEERLIHRPCTEGPRGPVRGYYATIKEKGGDPAFWYMSRDEVMDHRNKYAMSVVRNRTTKEPILDKNGQVQGSGPWFEMEGPAGGTGFDQNAIKTCFLKAQRFAPHGTDQTLARATEVDGSIRMSQPGTSHDPDEMLHTEHPDVVEGTLVDDDGPVPGAPPVADVGKPKASTAELVTEFDAVPEQGTDEPASGPQQRAMGTILGKAGVSADADRFAIVGRMVGRTPVPALDKLTKREASKVIDLLNKWQEAGALADQAAAILAAVHAPASSPGPNGSVVEAELAADAGKLPNPGTKAWHEARHPVVDGEFVNRDDLVTDGSCDFCLSDD